MSHKVLSANGDILSNTTQTIADITLAQAIDFDLVAAENQVVHTLVTPPRVTVQVSGIYYVNYTLNINLISGTNKTLETWVRVNGADVPATNNQIFIRTAGRERTSIQTSLGPLSVGDFVEIMMSGDSTSLQIVAEIAGTSPVRPAIPSIRALAFKVSDLYL